MKLLAVNKITVAKAGMAKRNGCSLGVNRMIIASANKAKVMKMTSGRFVLGFIVAAVVAALFKEWPSL